MVSAAEIKDEDSLRAWLEGRQREDAVAVAARAALRVAPLYWGWVADRSQNAGLTEVAIARAAAVAAVAAIRGNPGIAAAARNASASAAAAAASAAAFGTAAAATATAAVAAAANAAAGSSATDYDAAFAARATSAAVGHSAAWAAVLVDACEIEATRSPFRHPLWPEGALDKSLFVHRDWRARGGGWVFWADWYEGYLTGKPLDLNLLEQVALIPSEDWDKGDDHLNGIIAKIYGAHQIADAAGRFEADLVATVTATPGIGHNRPPEEISELPLFVPPIQEPLRAIRNQALAPRPDKGIVKDALAMLQGVLEVAGRYAAGKLDLAVNESIKAVVPWAWKAAIGWVVANQVGLIDFLKQATQWLTGL